MTCPGTGGETESVTKQMFLKLRLLRIVLTARGWLRQYKIRKLPVPSLMCLHYYCILLCTDPIYTWFVTGSYITQYLVYSQ